MRTPSIVLASLLFISPCVFAQPAVYDDHKNMMDQLGITQLRSGKNGSTQTGPGFDEATANPWQATMPEVLKMNNGTLVMQPGQWPARRAEILEDFECEIYGRIPANVPKVTWEVTATTQGSSGGTPTVTKYLTGHVDNSAYPQITVNIRASFTVPANASGPVPVMFNFGGVSAPLPDGPTVEQADLLDKVLKTQIIGENSAAKEIFDRHPTFRLIPGSAIPPTISNGGTVPWTQLAIAKGWGYGYIDPTSIQPDPTVGQGGITLTTAGIIGLTNKGQPRKPDNWGALRAWGWGVSRLIDYFAVNPDAKVDPAKVGIDGVSRYGKAALVTEAFDPRVAVALVASSGEGGAKLHRHDLGEAVENLTGGEYGWMAGNLIKYGAAEPFVKTAGDLPVDSHELIALCAPRPVFISYGVESAGDPKWVDAHGSFMAGVLAGPVYRLLGKQDFGTPGDYLTDTMPAVGQLIGGELAWRQHEGGHTEVPNWPAFFDWVGRYIKSPAAPVPVN